MSETTATTPPKPTATRRRTHQRLVEQRAVEAHIAVLAMAERQDLGYLQRGGAGTSSRCWTSESTYRLLTATERAAVRALLAEEVLRHSPGYRGHRGLLTMGVRRG